MNETSIIIDCIWKYWLGIGTFSALGAFMALIKHGAFPLILSTSPVLQKSYPRRIRSVDGKTIGFPPFFTDSCPGASTFADAWGIDTTCSRSRHRRRQSRYFCRRGGARFMAPSQSRVLRDRRRDAVLLMSACTALLVSAIITSAIPKRAQRAARTARRRLSFDAVVQYLSPQDFTRCFRMPREAFDELLRLLRPWMLRDERRARRCSGGVIAPAVRLAIFLRILGGASCLDAMLAFRVGRSTVYGVFFATLNAVIQAIPMPGLPVDNVEAMRKLATGFRVSRTPNSPLWGCTAALDGVFFAIRKPPDDLNPRHYLTRKGFYALPVQALVDASHKFLYMSARCVGSAHDSLAWACSHLGARLMSGTGLGEYWIAGDAAYVCSEHLLTPYSKVQLMHPELGPRRDAFNYFHSSLRTHVEQSFGILVARFGILWRPIRFSLATAPRIVSACMRVHNFCIDQGLPPISQVQEPAAVAETEAAFAAWWRNADGISDAAPQQGRRSDLGKGAKRDGLSDLLHDQGLHRPRYIQADWLEPQL
jgi:hypothetical protein